MIVYFTGTGNSRYCAQKLAADTGDALTDAARLIKEGTPAELRSDRPWVFVSPTYGWQIPRVFADFIRQGSFTGSRAAYFVMSCGSEIGDAGSRLQALCQELGFEYRGVLEVVMPENYVAMFPVPDAAEARQIIESAKPALDMGAKCVLEDRPFPTRTAGLVDKLKTGPVNALFYAFSITAKPFYVTDACVGCGKCVRDCPTNNVELLHGKPVWGANCVHCMACICLCPKAAVEYGKKSLGKPRYSCPEYKG